MKQVLYRLTAYIVSGAVFGAAGWMLLSSYVMDTRLPIVAFLVLSIAGLASAFVLLKRATVSISNGIRVNSLWTVAAMDSIPVIAASLVSLFLIDGYSTWFTGAPPLITNDPLALDIVSFMYLPSALILALFITSMGSQSVSIDENGLVVAGAFGEQSAKWNDIETISPDEQYVVVSRLDNPMPRQLRINLEISTKQGDSLTVYQPGLKSTARIILQRFKQFAPSRLQNDLTEMKSVWL